MGKYDVFGTTLNDWLNDPKVPNGCSAANVEYLRKTNEYIARFKRNSALLYFCLVHLDIKGCARMLLSSKKQTNFLEVMKGELKRRKIEKKYERVFERGYIAFGERLEYTFRITLENIRFTEYYPFFDEVGFDMLIDFDQSFGAEQLEYLLDMFDRWKAENGQKIDDYMKENADLIRAHKLARERVVRQAKAEKEYERQIKAYEREKERQTQKDVKKAREVDRKNATIWKWQEERYCN